MWIIPLIFAVIAITDNDEGDYIRIGKSGQPEQYITHWPHRHRYKAFEENDKIFIGEK